MKRKIALVCIPLLNCLLYFFATTINYEKALGLMVATLFVGGITLFIAVMARKYVTDISKRRFSTIGITYALLVVSVLTYLFFAGTADEKQLIWVIAAFAPVVVAPTVLGISFLFHSNRFI